LEFHSQCLWGVQSIHHCWSHCPKFQWVNSH
jgi:hypothetical protein